MTLERGNLIDLLNKDLALEYTAIVQYTQHSGVLTGAEYGDITKEIKIHAAQELQHAITLSEQIDYLGGFPTVNVPAAKVSEDNREMLQQDLEAELDAVARYQQRIIQTEGLQELALAQKLREILAMEQEHAMDLKNALGR